jgi:UDP-N-acetylglucosamine transferase subunit ALG13
VTFSVVVSAGTYHFGFDRLMSWTESWLDRHPDVQATVQHGTSRPVRGAANRDIIPHPELLDLYRGSSAVVLQGGAGGVMDARELGIIPIVVPRIPVGDEVVDDHQIVFAHRLESLGLIHVAESENELHRLLDLAVANELPVRPKQPAALSGPTAVAAALDALMAAPAVRRRTRLVRRLASPAVWRGARAGAVDRQKQRD